MNSSRNTLAAAVVAAAGLDIGCPKLELSKSARKPGSRMKKRMKYSSAVHCREGSLRNGKRFQSTLDWAPGDGADGLASNQQVFRFGQAQQRETYVRGRGRGYGCTHTHWHATHNTSRAQAEGLRERVLLLRGGRDAQSVRRSVGL